MVKRLLFFCQYPLRVLCYCKAIIGEAEWKHLGSDFGWEPGRICANLTRPPAEGRAREREGGLEVEVVGGGLNRNSHSDMFLYFFSFLFLSNRSYRNVSYHFLHFTGLLGRTRLIQVIVFQSGRLTIQRRDIEIFPFERFSPTFSKVEAEVTDRN